ncbi:MAG: YqhA family protein [Rhodospirillales bacterium]|jgi:uncharacterized protein (TIGR00645 family)|nr:YqhA family protein [Rhodospirillales bacterium]
MSDSPLARPLGRVVYAARWVMAPMYVGLAIALVFLVVKFLQKLIAFGTGLAAMDGDAAVLGVLRLVDITLVGNLVLIVLLAGWASVIGPLTGGRTEFAELDFGAVKLRLVASIAAIAAIQVLESFIHIAEVPLGRLLWELAVLLGIALAGVLLALMDRLSGGH